MGTGKAVEPEKRGRRPKLECLRTMPWKSITLASPTGGAASLKTARIKQPERL